MTFTFNATTALVTGASSGIGYALATGLAARGVNLIITARRKDRLEALAEQLGVQVTVVPIGLPVRDPLWSQAIKLRLTAAKTAPMKE